MVMRNIMKKEVFVFSTTLSPSTREIIFIAHHYFQSGFVQKSEFPPRHMGTAIQAKKQPLEKVIRFVFKNS